MMGAYGPQGWWPAESALEIVVGAILTQNTAWVNVERAIAALRRARLLSWERLRDIPRDELANVIRPAGTYRVKARRLKAFADVLFRRFAGSLDRMLTGDDVERVRDRLLSIHGIGPETADAILLYVAGIPTFVVDAYTKRILKRHYVLRGTESYEDIRTFVHRSLPADAALYNEYHALFVRTAKEHCRKSARCAGCPLEHLAHDPTR